MCDRCLTIERQLWNYRHAHETANDPLALALLAEVIEDFESQLASLHRVNTETGTE